MFASRTTYRIEEKKTPFKKMRRSLVGWLHASEPLLYVVFLSCGFSFLIQLWCGPSTIICQNMENRFKVRRNWVFRFLLCSFLGVSTTTSLSFWDGSRSRLVLRLGMDWLLHKNAANTLCVINVHVLSFPKSPEPLTLLRFHILDTALYKGGGPW